MNGLSEKNGVCFVAAVITGLCRLLCGVITLGL